MGNLALKLETGTLDPGSYNRAVYALTIGSRDVPPAERMEYIRFFARFPQSADAIMVLGSAIAEFGRNFTATERRAIARALHDSGPCPLTQALALSYARRAALRETDGETQALLHAVLTDIALE